MYSWDEDTSDWYGSKRYAYEAPSVAAAKARGSSAERAKAKGPRTYDAKGGPNLKVIDPKKHITTTSKNPVIVAVDVTGSMATWPREIFDRLPLLFNTLSQYREDVEISFVAIGDSGYDKWPLQCTTFASGYDLEQLLGGIYGEGGGGDAPESYGLFAHWVNTHVTVPNAEDPPFLIVFGDIHMHPTTPADHIEGVMGDSGRDIDSIKAWQKVTETWNTWFLRRPTQHQGDMVDQQWGEAIGPQKVFHIADEPRAVDTAMGLIARAWGEFDNFQDNMLARQDKTAVDKISKLIELVCPRCGGPIPVTASGMFSCGYCGTTLKI